MDFEIKEQNNDVLYDIPKVSFTSFDVYKGQATEIAKYIRTLDVSPDNVKDVKATLAKARKVTDRLNRARIDIKREILKNYNIFEAQVKELDAIITDAESELRTKVKALEEQERREKAAALYDIFQKRVEMYVDIKTLLPDAFETWLKPSHLNKTTTLKAAEEDMVKWLEEVTAAIGTARSMGEEYLAEYVLQGNLATAIQAVLARKAVQDVISSQDLEGEEKALFEVKGPKDIKMVEMFMEQNQINYTRR